MARNTCPKIGIVRALEHGRLADERAREELFGTGRSLGVPDRALNRHVGRQAAAGAQEVLRARIGCRRWRPHRKYGHGYTRGSDRRATDTEGRSMLHGQRTLLRPVCEADLDTMFAAHVEIGNRAPTSHWVSCPSQRSGGSSPKPASGRRRKARC